MSDLFLFVIFPYVSLVLFFVVAIQRYRNRPFTYSSLSSQFLENDYHFWGSVPFHYGIGALFFGHLLAFICPRWILLWNSYPLRLYILEISGLIFALLTLSSLVNLIVRRMVFSRARVVTSIADWILLGLLIIQIFLGIYVALFLPWGSSWFASSLSPYLWSLIRLNPNLSYISPLPWSVKLHIFGAFALIAFLPFTRLVHILVIPLPYLWRKPQIVRWNYREFPQEKSS